MTRSCELIGTSILVGNKVSHSNHKTKKRFLPNLRNVTLVSNALGVKVSMRIAASSLRTVDKYGGLDDFLTSVPRRKLATKAKILQKKVQDAIVKKNLDIKSDKPVATAKKNKVSRVSKRINKKLEKKSNIDQVKAKKVSATKSVKKIATPKKTKTTTKSTEK